MTGQHVHPKQKPPLAEGFVGGSCEEDSFVEDSFVEDSFVEDSCVEDSFVEDSFASRDTESAC
jgi:hypothetical protein